jgi:hypothetical protein
MTDELGTCADAVGKKLKMYTKLPTYRMVVIDQCSKNSELLSHLPIAVCMSWAESLQLLQKALYKLGKAYAHL